MANALEYIRVLIIAIVFFGASQLVKQEYFAPQYKGSGEYAAFQTGRTLCEWKGYMSWYGGYELSPIFMQKYDSIFNNDFVLVDGYSSSALPHLSRDLEQNGFTKATTIGSSVLWKK